MERKRTITIAIVICVSLLALVSGAVWRTFLTEKGSAPTIDTLEKLTAYEPKWKVLAGKSVDTNLWENKVVLINFWASWCPPCIEEMPLLDQFNADNDSVHVVGIAVDFEEKAEKFLAENEIEFPSLYMDASTTNELVINLGDSENILPYSVAFSQSGQLSFTKLGPVSQEDLASLLP